MNPVRTALLAALLAGTLLIGANSPIAGSGDTKALQGEQSVESQYVLAAGDVLEIKFFFTPELNQTVPIRPDGKISLQLIEDLQAAGATPAELKKTLLEQYTVYLKKPDVAVIVKEFGAENVYVGGEVANPHLVPLRGRLTALQAIFSSGGFRESAHTSSVLIISKGEDGLPTSRKVNLKIAMSGRELREDAVLRAYDIVFVPKSRIGKVNKFVDQYINNIVPHSLIFGGFSYVRYSGQQTYAVPVTPP